MIVRATFIWAGSPSPWGDCRIGAENPMAAINSSQLRRPVAENLTMRQITNRQHVSRAVRGILAVAVGLAVLTPRPAEAQVDRKAELAAFQTRIDAYVEMHRRLEGPLPPIQVTKDMDEVHRLMDALRAKIRAARGPAGNLITPALVTVFKEVIAATLTLADVVNVSEEIEEHTPPRMAKVRANEPLPGNAPFVTIPPPLLRALPELPPELRYIALSGALIIWDQHADLVVDIMPRLFDPLTYSKKTGS